MNIVGVTTVHEIEGGWDAFLQPFNCLDDDYEQRLFICLSKPVCVYKGGRKNIVVKCTETQLIQTTFMGQILLDHLDKWVSRQ